MINITDQMMFHLNNLNKENLRINYQLSTGQALQKGSDDTAVFSKDLYFGDKIRVYEGVQSQIQRAMTLNDTVDSTLATVKLDLDVVKTSLLKTLNAGMQQSDKLAVATEIEGIKENFFAWANTNINNEYIFAGSNSTQQPFVKDANGKVTYVGDNVLKQVPVEPNSYRDRGVTGYDAFMYTTDTAKVGGNLEFLASEKIVDNDGNTWNFPETSGVGEKLDFFENDLITDSAGQVWTLNQLDSTISNGSVTLDVVKYNGGYQFKNDLSNDFKNGDGDIITSFTTSAVFSTAESATKLTVVPGQIITDNTGNTWSLNPMVPEITNGLGDSIALTAAGANFEFTSPLSSFSDANGNTINEFTSRSATTNAITGTAQSGTKLTITPEDKITDNTGSVWTLDPDIPEMRNEFGNAIALEAVGDNFVFANELNAFNNGSGETVNSFTTSSNNNQIRQYDKYGNLTGEVLSVVQIDNGDGIADGAEDTGLLEPKYRTANLQNPSIIMETKHNIFDDLDDIITTLNGRSLTDGVTPIDETEQNETIRSMLGKMEDIFNAVNIAHSKVGSRNKIIEDASVNISAKITNFNILSIQNGKADLTKVAMEAKSLEMTYTALYSTISRMQSLNLVNFLK